MRTRHSRALLGLLTGALLTGGSLAAPAQAVTPPAHSAADWLQSQLTGGLVHNNQYDFDDIGLTLDFFLAFHELGVKRKAQNRIIKAVEPETGSYVGTGSEAYAAQLGKLLTAVQSHGDNPSSYAGGGLFKRLAGLIKRSGPQAGRAVDSSKYGNFTNTIGQSFVVRALALGDRPLAPLTARFLVKQQCAAGYFREEMDSSDFTCQTGRSEGVSAPSLDATAFAVLALRTARSSGVGGLRHHISAAIRWLKKHQNRNGSFTGNGAPNTNSTGLAAEVLAGPAPRAAARAARWLHRHQVTRHNAAGTPLAHSLGAVAYDTKTLRTGMKNGITRATRDQWRRATAQAALGLDALGR